MSTCLDQLDQADREQLVTALHTKQAFFWVGSGFSRNFGFMSWNSVITGLKKQYGYAGVLPPDNPLRAAELLCATAQAQGSDEAAFSTAVCELLVASKTDSKRPGWCATFAKYAGDIIVTTNWDQVLEKEVFDEETNVVVRRTGSTQLSRSRRNILKIHGDIDYPHSLVFTWSQYNAFQREDSYLSRKVYTLFTERTPIFIGYSLSDPNIFALFDEARVDGGETNHGYMIVPRETEPATLAEHRLLLGRKGISIIQASIEDFFKAIDAAMKTLEGTVQDFTHRYDHCLAAISNIIETASKGNKKWETLAKGIKNAETAAAIMTAFSELLNRPDLYEQLGGKLSLVGNRIPIEALHIIAQTFIKVSNNLNVDNVSLKRKIIELSIRKLQDREFTSSGSAFTNLLSLHLTPDDELLLDKMQEIFDVLNWSAPKYQRGYCWETWSIFEEKKKWLREYEIDHLLALASNAATPDGPGSNTKRWIEELLPILKGEQKARAIALL